MNIFARNVRNSIRRVLKRREPKDVIIGLHKVRLTQQAYRGKNNNIYISYLLARILFGVNNSKFTDLQKIYKTNNVCLVAIASAEQAKNIFTISGDCAMEMYVENNVNNNNDNNNNNNNNIVRHCAAGKVRIQVVATGGDAIIGYVLSENADTRQLTVHLDNDDVVVIPPPIYDPIHRSWNTAPFIYDGTLHEVDYYEPILILISKLGYISYIIHRFVCNVNTITNAITIKSDLCS